MKTLEGALSVEPRENPPKIVEIPKVGNFEHAKAYKVRRFRCKSLKGRGSQSGIRIIYVYEPKENKISFIQIYFKGDKTVEDKQRVKDYLKMCKQRHESTRT